jgi:hypothetical protein
MILLVLVEDGGTEASFLGLALDVGTGSVLLFLGRLGSIATTAAVATSSSAIRVSRVGHADRRVTRGRE